MTTVMHKKLNQGVAINRALPVRNTAATNIGNAIFFTGSAVRAGFRVIHLEQHDCGKPRDHIDYAVGDIRHAKAFHDGRYPVT